MTDPQQAGQLYIVPTPIGNLADITQRAVEVLGMVDLIAAEDTRHTAKLLSVLGIKAGLLSLHSHNESARTEQILVKLAAGQQVALVSDAGTPLISDPGFPLVRAVREAGYRVTPLPGACAAITALSASGLPTDRFCFEGFLPAKASARKQRLQELATEPRTQVYYESPRRVLDTLSAIVEVMGGSRQLVLARELTKQFETIHHASAAELLDWVSQDENQQKGEMVLIVEGYQVSGDESLQQAIALASKLTEWMPSKAAAALAAETFGCKKNQIYKALH